MKKSFKYLYYLLICLFAIPCMTFAASHRYVDLGTLGPGATQSKAFTWWDFEKGCTTTTPGPFTWTTNATPYEAKDSWYRYIALTINSYVDKDYNDMEIQCTVIDDITNPDQSGRISTYDTIWHFSFDITKGGEAVPVAGPEKSYYLYKGDSAYITTDLGIQKIVSIEHGAGKELNTISYSGCSTGTSSCYIKYDSGAYAPLQDREHIFAIVYVGTNGTLYRSTVRAYEMDTKRTFDLGTVEPTGSVYGDYLDGVTNFQCANKYTGVPAIVDKDGSGNRYRIKVTNNNKTSSAYSGKAAVCTFTKDGITHEYTYAFSLKGNNPEEIRKDYVAYPNDTFNVFADLGIKTIISATQNTYNGLTYSGCVANATDCKVTMKSSLVNDRFNTISIYYYDTANKFKHAEVVFKEQSTTKDLSLGIIGVGNGQTAMLGELLEYSCATPDASKPYQVSHDNSGGFVKVTIKNVNTTVNPYTGLSYTCTGKPKGVGDRTFTYNISFGLSAESTPIVNDRHYELFPGETLDFADLYKIKSAKSFNYETGKDFHSISLFGCENNSTLCKASFTGTALHNRQHKIVLTYVNQNDVLYKTNVIIVEKDPSITTKAYPGVLGFCQFNDDWEMASWADSSGKNYTYFEAIKKGAVLPDCKVDANKNSEGLPLSFKGWTKGYKAGDALTTMSTCGSDLLAPGEATSYGQTYAPCYEMTPHVRVSTNSGTLVNANGFTFRSSDMTYIKFGSSFTEQVNLPDVQYTGFSANSSLGGWRNSSTGEVKLPGDPVKLDGSVWVAISNRTVSQVDLYKTVGLGEQVKWVVPNMLTCTLATGASDYVSIVSSVSEECTIQGDVITPYDVYADVFVTLSDGTVRTYKFNVEDRSDIAGDDNGIFNVDTDDDIVVGKNDEETLNDYKTDQCVDFLINNDAYDASKFKNGGFATSKDGVTAMDTGIYKVYQQCPTDRNKYVALCLDPGRRGPNETGTGSSSHTFKYYDHSQGKVVQITKTGVLYKKTSDVQKDSEFGKLVMYIVQNMDIDKFDQSTSDIKNQRAAAHVAVRSMAIYTGFSRNPDPSHQTYATHYYPYLGVADGLEDVLSDGVITRDEAEDIVDNGRDGNGFNWKITAVRNYLVDILSNYIGTDTSEDFDGFERTIDETNYQADASGKGYTINYKGTITAPTGATVDMVGKPGDSNPACRNNSEYGVTSCTVNSFTEQSDVGGRKTYAYDVTIRVDDASKVKPPENDDQEKDLSFQLTYTSGHDLVNAFIASAADSSVNVQRMLIISTTNPTVYIYFSVIPNKCDLSVLDPALCQDETTCVQNINNNKFNPTLFKAAGCCRYENNEKSYLFMSVCSANCTSSTMSSVCEYVADGKEKADLYEIKEGSQFKDETTGYQDAIGTCIVNVSDYFQNDNANFLSAVDPGKNYTKYDDAQNLINVDQYDTNRYCQVTCKEDWQFSMDSFGNFIGKDAVAAGTYFQIVSNDMFMSGKRTCYTTFINYDRFAANVVDISNELVAAYNRYSKWSHVWTDVNLQATKKTYSSVKDFDHKDSGDGIVCAEYYAECPDDYYWDKSATVGRTKGCRQVPNFKQGVSNPLCQAKPTAKSEYSHRDTKVVYDNGGANEAATNCVFTRRYCDNQNFANATETLQSDDTCSFYYSELRDYYSSPSQSKVDPDGSGPKGLECPSGTSASGSNCYAACSSGYYRSGSRCYKNSCPTAGGVVLSPISGSNYCDHTFTGLPSHTIDLDMKPAYYEKDLMCKVWGKGYDYTLGTENDFTKGNNTDNKDVYYSTEEYDSDDSYGDRESIADYSGPINDNNRQNKPIDDGQVKGNYDNQYTHNCELTWAKYDLGEYGSSNCQAADVDTDAIGLDPYEDKMFCDKYAVLSNGDDSSFCYAGGTGSDTHNNYSASPVTTDQSKEEDAFTFITDNFRDHAKKELDNARYTMQSKYNAIYDHAHDLFNCQNFELRNTSDDDDPNRTNNPINTGTIMGKTYNFVNIPTQFAPFATYDYDEKMFMDRITKEDRYLIQYTEKNDGLFTTLTGEQGEGKGQVCSNEFGKSTNCRVDATITTPDGPVQTKLSRNYLTNDYYNPPSVWLTTPEAGESTQTALDRVNKYEDPRYTVNNPAKISKKITFCTVGVINNGTAYMDGKDGAYVAFTSTSTTPEWLGGRCYQATVDYYRVHYVKSSIENSSYYKNKGYWYVRGGDSKIHGDDIEDAIDKFNNLDSDLRSGASYNSSDSEELKRWSRLGSFNVFPISMATPRNMYAYTYSFGNVGSYYDDKLGRIMGNGEQSIIPQNVRTCVYEVYEEVCLCCGYKVEPDKVVEDVINNPNVDYDPSDPSKAGGNTHGNITFYTNSVSLGDLSLGRDSGTLGTNWSSNSPFMYNGDEMTTDKGALLKDNIEHTGENIYAREPEYAYYLTPDTLKQIRSYNDAVGYDLNLEKLIVYDVSKIECNGSNCEAGDAETINFQHYGSKFLAEQINGPISLKRYGLVDVNNYDKVCIITDNDYESNPNLNMATIMKNGSCRWVDFVETDQQYYNPTTKQTSNTLFRLSFK